MCKTYFLILLFRTLQGNLLLKAVAISRLFKEFCFYEEDVRKCSSYFLRLCSLSSKKCSNRRLALVQLRKGIT
jgi:hypothetical protein